ncbi:hypothetical protein As57867_024003, partial [Aphanomyces stellatus]
MGDRASTVPVALATNEDERVVDLDSLLAQRDYVRDDDDVVETAHEYTPGSPPSSTLMAKRPNQSGSQEKLKKKVKIEPPKKGLNLAESVFKGMKIQVDAQAEMSTALVDSKAKEFEYKVEQDAREGIINAASERIGDTNDPEYQSCVRTIHEKCHKICKHWDVLDEVMGDRASTVPVALATNEDERVVDLDSLLAQRDYGTDLPPTWKRGRVCLKFQKSCNIRTTSLLKMKQRMTLADKSNLLAEHKRNPQATYSDLAKWAHQAFGLASTPTKSTIGKALKQDFSKVKSPELEAELLQWVLRCEELGVCLTGELIREHAKEIAERLNLP